MFMWSNDFVDALGFNRYMVECEYGFLCSNVD